MTNETEAQLVPVEAIDRAAACAILIPKSVPEMYRPAIMAGEWDHTEVPQVMARHRIMVAADTPISVLDLGKHTWISFSNPTLDSFVSTILEKTPNGERIAVQYHPNGDWSVAHLPMPADNQATDIAFVEEFGDLWLDGSVSAKTVLLAYLLERKA